MAGPQNWSNRRTSTRNSNLRTFRFKEHLFFEGAEVEERTNSAHRLFTEHASNRALSVPSPFVRSVPGSPEPLAEGCFPTPHIHSAHLFDQQQGPFKPGLCGPAKWIRPRVSKRFVVELDSHLSRCLSQAKFLQRRRRVARNGISSRLPHESCFLCELYRPVKGLSKRDKSGGCTLCRFTVGFN